MWIFRGVPLSNIGFRFLNLKFARLLGSKTRLVLTLLFSLFALAGCGFRPLYSNSESGIGPVVVSQIDTRIGYFLRQKLENYTVLERGDTAPRTLNVVLRKTSRDTNLRSDGFRTRIQIIVYARYELVGADGKIDGEVSTSVGYDGGADANSEIALSSDAEERAANQLAERIWVDLVNKARR